MAKSDILAQGREDSEDADHYDDDDGIEGEAALTETQRQQSSAKQNPFPPDPKPLLTQALVVSIPRNFRVDINIRGDELKREDLGKIKSQFNRWIEGLEEAFEE